MFSLLKEAVEKVKKALSKSKKEDKKEQTKEQKTKERKEKQKKQQKREKAKPSISITKKIIGKITKEIELTEDELKKPLDELEMNLIRAGVAFEVAENIKKELMRSLTKKKIKENEINSIIEKELMSLLSKYITGIEWEKIKEKIKEKKPFIIMLFGPNGVGKTTTAAKIAHLLKQEGFSTLLVAADTFRAGSIEQLKTHAKAIETDIFYLDYKTKPSTVIYQALQKAKNYDVVIIDTAGRQDININLMKELEKMVKVAKPDLKLYVAESITGNAIVDQITEYKKIVGIDGLVLTKLDLDEKGGTLISAAYTAKVPIYFLSTGQGYNQLKSYSPNILEDILT